MREPISAPLGPVTRSITTECASTTQVDRPEPFLIRQRGAQPKKPKMRLSPREEDHLMLHTAGCLAQKRLARGLKLNYTESVALLATQVGRSLSQRILRRF
jgi:hypothetical protein